MADEEKNIINEKLDAIIELFQTLVALELSKSGVNQGQIGKRIHVATATVGKILEGVKKDKSD